MTAQTAGMRRFSSHSADVFEKAISDAKIEECVKFLQALKIPQRYRNPNIKTSFAVLIPFCRDRDSRPCLLVQQRSLKMRRDRGMICFPGGVQDDADSNDHVRTALRETEEEVGVDSSRIRIFGTAAPFPARNGMGMLHPVIGFVDLDFSNGRTPFKLNLEEVENVHLVPLENLVKKENWRYTRWRGKLALPVYRDEVFNDKDVPRIWGITAMMIHFAMNAILPNEYKFSFDIIQSQKP